MVHETVRAETAGTAGLTLVVVDAAGAPLLLKRGATSSRLHAALGEVRGSQHRRIQCWML